MYPKKIRILQNRALMTYFLSDFLVILIGVIQGFNLGPLLFVLLANVWNVCHAMSPKKTQQFATVDLLAT